MPDLAIHSAFDVNSDPSHPGLWRGIFPHKNEAGAAMVILVIVGFYIATAASRVLGWSIVLLAAGLLVASGSKTAILLSPGDPRRHGPLPGPDRRLGADPRCCSVRSRASR